LEIIEVATTTLDNTGDLEDPELELRNSLDGRFLASSLTQIPLP
jgi:hypothetical protein